MDNIPSILDTAKYRHLVLDGVENIANSIQGFQIPEYDEIEITYYGATNNIEYVGYFNGGAHVAQLRLEYATQPPTANDTNLAKVTITYP